jgi:serine/threonine protein kinase
VLEARSASSLNHPNIVTIYEIGEEPASSDGLTDRGQGSVHFISMELIAGETLGRKIHEEKCDLKSLLGWLAQAAEGISKAHAAGIVHRDLKPGNIMITTPTATRRSWTSASPSSPRRRRRTFSSRALPPNSTTGQPRA